MLFALRSRGAHRGEVGRTIGFVEDVIFTLLAVLVAPLVLIGVTAGGFFAWLRRSNRVGPGLTARGVPFTWLWSPGAAASLHRRLRSACQLAASVAGPARRVRRGRGRRSPGLGSVAELAREVMDEAVRLDGELLAMRVAYQGAARAHALASLDDQVRQVEDAARRVHNLAGRQAMLVSSAGGNPLSLSERIASMEAAMGELHARP